MRWPYPTPAWRLLRPLHHYRPTAKFANGEHVAGLRVDSCHRPLRRSSRSRRWHPSSCDASLRAIPKEMTLFTASEALRCPSGGWSNRRFRASTAWAMLSFPASAFSVVRCRLPPTSVSSSAAFSASWRAFTSVVGSRRRSSLWTSFDATPQMKRATKSLSDFPARRPNSATSWANSPIDWFFRCFRPLNRTARTHRGRRCQENGVSARPRRCPEVILAGTVLSEQQYSLKAWRWQLAARMERPSQQKNLPLTRAIRLDPFPGRMSGVGRNRHFQFPSRQFPGQAPIVTSRSLEQAR
ncbi:conserved hypothetical protein [Trichinella spiralis]|uniref:hypothetical protein n=1 Tax=Trichinella spiralis TaxID=6334 RepID=UPI0001EFDC32|nr:conserved hypothetical protein [Trichinella spiralis]